MLWERASWLPPRLIAPTVGLKPKQPQKLAGRKIEPNTWVPSATLTAPAATAAAEPLLEPPGVRVSSHGLRVARGSIHANSVVTVLPRITPPASRSAATLALSRSLRKPANNGEPLSVGMSIVSMMSLIPIGMPSIGESGLPARQRFEERSAAALAPARLMVTKAPIFGSQASRSAMQRSRNWRGESFPLTKSAAAGRKGRIRGFIASGAFIGSLPLPCVAFKPGREA